MMVIGRTDLSMNSIGQIPCLVWTCSGKEGFGTGTDNAAPTDCWDRSVRPVFPRSDKWGERGDRFFM